MDQNKRQAVALMRYSAIAPLIAGTQEDYESLRAYYRDVSAKGIKAPDGQIRHYSPGTIQKWHLAYKNAGFDGLLPTGRSDCGVSRKIDDALGEEIRFLKHTYPRLSAAERPIPKRGRSASCCPAAATSRPQKKKSPR